MHPAASGVIKVAEADIDIDVTIVINIMPKNLRSFVLHNLTAK